MLVIGICILLAVLIYCLNEIASSGRTDSTVLLHVTPACVQCFSLTWCSCRDRPRCFCVCSSSPSRSLAGWQRNHPLKDRRTVSSASSTDRSVCQTQLLPGSILMILMAANSPFCLLRAWKHTQTCPDALLSLMQFKNHRLKDVFPFSANCTDWHFTILTHDFNDNLIFLIRFTSNLNIYLN